MKLNFKKLKIDTQWIKHSWIDLKRDKAKSIFGILGISISIFLLTAIGMVNDTRNYNYLDIVTNQMGSADIWITRSLSLDQGFELYFNHTYVEDAIKDLDVLDGTFPRLQIIGVNTTNLRNDEHSSILFYGMDFEKEAAAGGKIGNLIICDENLTETGEIYTEIPEDGHVVILKATAVRLNASKGDDLHLIYQNKEIDVEIDEICVQDLKFSELENNQILMDIEPAQDWLNLEDKASMVMAIIKNREYIYDSSDITGTTIRLRDIGEQVQKILPMEEYSVAVPKLEELEMSEMMMIGQTIMFWFISFLSMMITGILINGILSTSAEERIREFGITRVLGGKKVYSIKMVLFEGMLLGGFGTLVGVVTGIFVTPFFIGGILDVFMAQYDIVYDFIISPQTIFLVVFIGVTVSLTVSFLPAIKTARIKLIKAITPFQTKEEGWEVAKEGSMNTKGFLVGISIATIGSIIFILLPRIMSTMNILLIAGIFIGLLVAILLGFVFASVGVIPFLESFFVYTLQPFFRKYMNIIKISLKRNQRRNTGTIVMFAISFSFIFFITTSSEIENQTWSLNLKFQYGSDLVLANYALDSEHAFTEEIVEELKEIPGIDDVAPIIHNSPLDISSIFSLLDLGGGNGGMSMDMSEEEMTELFQQIQSFTSYSASKFDVSVSDVIDFSDIACSLFGIDERYVNLVDKNLFIWKSLGSGTNTSFTSVLTRNDTCIISKAIASQIGITEVGQKVRLTIKVDNSDPGTGNITILEVAGISGGMPGFWNFRTSEWSAQSGGVMVNMELYSELMNWAGYGTENMIVDKVLINLADPSEETIKETKQYINDEYPEKTFTIDDAITKINFMEEMNREFSLLSEIILLFTVIICIFGLVSSMYATILERTLEIGVLRALGLKVREVRNMFLLESMILMISAGLMGMFIGSYTAYLMESNMSLITELPTVFTIPRDTIIRVFGISIAVGVLGMFLILLKLSRQTLMDIFRQTF
jgi:ABC-type antimicrobial peptide transport system permease subunit